MDTRTPANSPATSITMNPVDDEIQQYYKPSYDPSAELEERLHDAQPLIIPQVVMPTLNQHLFIFTATYSDGTFQKYQIPRCPGQTVYDFTDLKQFLASTEFLHGAISFSVEAAEAPLNVPYLTSKPKKPRKAKSVSAVKKNLHTVNSVV